MKNRLFITAISVIILGGWILMLAGCQEDTEVPASGMFIDHRDNHEYEWVTIGDQVWMADNLAYLPSVCSPDEASDTIPLYYVIGYYGTSVSSARQTDGFKSYGVFYNWSGAMNGADSLNENGELQGICPDKWHLPSDAEWDQLVNYLGGDTTAGKKLKSATGWKRYGTNSGRGTNSSGFNAIPAGSRNNGGKFFEVGYNALFWSSTPIGTYSAWYRHLGYNHDVVSRYFISKQFGFSVRCVKNAQ